LEEFLIDTAGAIVYPTVQKREFIYFKLPGFNPEVETVKHFNFWYTGIALF